MTAFLLLFGLLLQTAKTYVISGTLVHSVTGKPLNKARVYVAPTEDRTKMTTVITGADGRFRFEGLTEGKYQLGADRVAFVVQNYAQRSLYQAYASAVAVGESKASQDLVFRLIPGAVLTGYVTDSQGEGVPGLQVQTLRVIGAGTQRRVQRSQTGSTDDRGYYRIHSLAAGNFMVAFSGRTWQRQELPGPEPMAYPTTYYPGETSAQRAGIIRLEAGKETRADVVVRPVNAVALEGQVTPATKPGQLAVTLSVPGPLGSDLAFGSTSAVYGDRFNIRDIPAGSYFLNLWEDQTRLIGRRPVEVSAATTSVTIGETVLPSISASVEIRGVPRMPGMPTVISLVQVSTASGSSRVVDVSGQTVFTSIPPGRYQLAVGKGRQLPVISATAKGAILSGGILDVPETGQVELTIVADAAAAEITGLVVRGSEPQSGVLVMLVPEKGWEIVTNYRFDQSDSDGTFTWYGVAPGEYLMFVLEEGEPADYVDAEVVRKLLPKSFPLTVTDAPKQSVRLPLPR